QLLLASPVVLWCGLPIWHRFFLSLQNRSANMFTLIGAGTAVSYVFSIVVLLLGNRLPSEMLQHGQPPLYFESAAAIASLVLLGQVLELHARSRASGAIRALLA